MAKDAKDVKAITSKFKSKKSAKESAYPVTLQNAMTSLPTNPAIAEGIPALRLTSGTKWKSRVITLSTDKQAFFVTHDKLPNGFSSQLASTLPIPFWSRGKGFRWTNDSERYIRHFDIADIDGWQVGAVGVQSLEALQKKFSESQVETLVTIFHHGRLSVSFQVPDKKHRQYLVEAFVGLKQRYNLMSPWISNDQLLLRYIYYDIDADKSGTISRREFREILKRINFTAPPNVNKLYDNFAHKSKELTIQEALQLLKEISTGDTEMPAERLWNKLFGKDTTEVGPKKLLKHFFHRCQGETNLEEEDSRRFLKSMGSFANESSKFTTKVGFVHYLHSKYNDAYDPAGIAALPSTTKLDMPLSNYWINTSHNTYLMGDQLKSKSSVQAYEDALLRGCKCLEFDCWDGDMDKKTKECVPVIYHGHTLTSKMTFRSACLVAMNYLNANPKSYPIILSLENHCSLPFQEVMAKDMNRIFGKKLFIPTEKQCLGADLPTPEELRGMIVIKGKRPPEPDEGSGTTSSIHDTDYDDGFHSDDDDDDGSAKESHNTKSFKKKKSEKPKKKVESQLRKFTLLHGAHFKDFEQSIVQIPTNMHSIGETKITKIVTKSVGNAKLWREYNKNHMTRTYPAGGRVDSSNYNPILAWALGCQLVALNFQTSDSCLALNDGRFRQAGNCGYIHKPASVMGGPKPDEKKLKISVLSARCLPKPKGAKRGELIDPYIQIDVHDVRLAPTGTEKHCRDVRRTSTVDNNGFCPRWEENNTFAFEVVNPDVAMVHFRIIDDDLGADDKIASSAIPFRWLRKGYRCVQLYEQNDTRTGPFESSSLFVKIEY